MNRKITVELVMFGKVMEYSSVPVEQAKEILSRKMNHGCRWRIALPDRTGAILDDEERYAKDCEACGVNNPWATA